MGISEANARHMNPLELRQTILMQNQRIETLTKVNASLSGENNTLKDWNSKWQSQRWNDELANEVIHGFVKLKYRGNLGLKDSDIIVLGYLCSIQGNSSADRHVRGIARNCNLGKTACSTALDRLQHKKLVRAWLRDAKKKFYTLPAAKQLIDKANIRPNIPHNLSNNIEKETTFSKRAINPLLST